MPFSRRRFLQAAGVAALAPTAPLVARRDTPHLIRPPRLRRGDTVGLINPAGVLADGFDLFEVRDELDALGLKVKLGAHVLDRYGYLAGTDEARAADVHAMFADPDVRAVLAVRGGWGCARILPLLDYELIRRNPKVLMGYSDLTALLLAVYARSGLVTFHGPVGVSTWNDFTVEHVFRVLFDGEAVLMEPPAPALPEPQDGGAGRFTPRQTIHPGTARGRLAGGNLSVLAAMVGSAYLPAWNGHVLFLEEIGEEVYRVDRMLNHLKLAGVLDGLAGFVFGNCTDCDPEDPEHALTLAQVLADHVLPLEIPAWTGARIGHISDKFTVPLGIEAEIDAARGTIRLLEPAVSS